MRPPPASKTYYIKIDLSKCQEKKHISARISTIPTAGENIPSLFRIERDLNALYKEEAEG
jgi:hypothetical protein